MADALSSGTAPFTPSPIDGALANPWANDIRPFASSPLAPFASSVPFAPGMLFAPSVAVSTGKVSLVPQAVGGAPFPPFARVGRGPVPRSKPGSAGLVKFWVRSAVAASPGRLRSFMGTPPLRHGRARQESSAGRDCGDASSLSRMPRSTRCSHQRAVPVIRATGIGPRASRGAWPQA